MGVRDCKGHFGDLRLGRKSLVMADGDHLILVQGDERHPVVVINFCEVNELCFGQLSLDSEEAEVAALGAMGLKETSQAIDILRSYGPDSHYPAVPKHEIDVIVFW